jgi:hypothetical protein
MKAILNRRAQKIKNLPERRLQRLIKEARHNIEELRGLYHAEGLSVWEKNTISSQIRGRQGIVNHLQGILSARPKTVDNEQVNRD